MGALGTLNLSLLPMAIETAFTTQETNEKGNVDDKAFGADVFVSVRTTVYEAVICSKLGYIARI